MVWLTPTVLEKSPLALLTPVPAESEVPVQDG